MGCETLCVQCSILHIQCVPEISITPHGGQRKFRGEGAGVQRDNFRGDEGLTTEVFFFQGV